MPPAPTIDARTFTDLIREAQAIAAARCPDWTDMSPGDPGTTLLEVYAYLTETMLYRLNRLPDRLHVALLKLLGVGPMPPAAAVTTLVFTRPAANGDTPPIPTGTRVSDAASTITFTTLAEARFAPGALEATVLAIHADPVEGELLGMGTGEAGQSLRVRRAPVVRATQATDDLIIGVETAPAQVPANARTRTLGAKTFLLWDERAGFTDSAGRTIYAADRTEGRISFAPAAGVGQGIAQTLAQIPNKGAEIRAWYLTGGGRAGNVAPNTLTLPRTPLPTGITVTNPSRATGGEDGETSEQVITRGRDAVRVLDCAVTAGDFERVARMAGGVARARSYAQKEFWAYGAPGVVETLIVPRVLPDDATGAVTLEAIKANQTAELMARVTAALDERRPLGVRCAVRWASCRPVSVAARIAVAPSEDTKRLHARIEQRLNAVLSPVTGWPFGKTLRTSDIYEAILAEPGVRYAEQLTLRIDGEPSAEVNRIVNDPCQARGFFALTKEAVYRSLDEGESWAPVLRREGTVFDVVACNPDVPGQLAAVGETGNGSWLLTVSDDSGETWTDIETIQHEIYDLAWVRRDRRRIILLAARNGLFQVDRDGPRGLLPVDVAGAGKDGDGFFAVTSGVNQGGTQFVAVAKRSKGGVFVSREGGATGTFVASPGSADKDIRQLSFQRQDGQLFLWAAVWAEGGEAGEGLMRTAARSDGLDPAGWTVFSQGWKGGSCRAFDVAGTLVVAGTREAGVLVLDLSSANPSWKAPLLTCGLPIDTDRAKLLPVSAIAAGARSGQAPVLLAGAGTGLFRGDAASLTFTTAGGMAFTDRAPLPPNWLYCAAPHELTVVTDIDEREH